jgi:prephenate dehydrogenase
MPLSQLTILAPGLLGGSIARAARERGAARRIVIWARRPEVRGALAQEPWCDEAPDSPEAAAEAADLTVIAAPVNSIVPLARQIAPRLGAGAIVSDVGSVKGEIARQGDEAVRQGRGRFVGAHPMAGSEKTGWEHGSPGLFEHRTCFVTPLPETDPRAVEIVSGFWRDLGATVVRVDPALHDRIVAHISHLPQAVASVLCGFLAAKDPAWRGFAGGGLRDTTRIAAGDPWLWRTIFEQNREEVLQALAGLRAELAAFESALDRCDWADLTARLDRAKEYRDGLR